MQLHQWSNNPESTASLVNALEACMPGVWKAGLKKYHQWLPNLRTQSYVLYRLRNRIRMRMKSAGCLCGVPLKRMPSAKPWALGLPAPAADAIKGGGALVLLIVQKSAIDDRLVEDSIDALSSRPGVTLIVVPVDKIARYSRITQSVGVNRTPALVVVRPEAVSKTPEATVSYGFRDSKSVIQAVDDAVYSGKDNIPYHPG